MRLKINMVGGGFQHQISSHREESKWIELVKNGAADVSMHIDHAITEPVNPTKRNFAWIFESTAIVPGVVNYLITNIAKVEENFELIFTHDKRLLSLSPKMRWCVPQCKAWIKESKIYPKTKLISMIASTKVMCQGHLYRQEIAQKYKNKVDLYGNGHRRIEDKIEGLADYCFSISMENDSYPTNFTEKLADCFATGTIPIFWGATDVGEYFNSEGIIFLDDKFDIDELSFDLYQSKLDFVEENFTRLKKFPNPEDFLFVNYFSKII